MQEAAPPVLTLVICAFAARAPPSGWIILKKNPFLGCDFLVLFVMYTLYTHGLGYQKVTGRSSLKPTHREVGDRTRQDAVGIPITDAL